VARPIEARRRVIAAIAALCGAWLVMYVTTLPAASQATGSVPRTSWGEPDLTGVWLATDAGAAPGKDRLNLAALERLYKPEARAAMARLTAQDDPTLGCEPPAFPRAAILGRPIQLVQRPGLVVVLTEAFHSFRAIPTDARAHPEDRLFPSFLGDASGKWDGDTLVVDVVSFNGQTWLANPRDKPTAMSRGVWPTSVELHMTERWRRIDVNTLEYQATVRDSEMLTGPWETAAIRFRRQSARRLQVEKCFVDDPSTRLDLD
jgi:hypothetical protein